jgi:hypothetical protein
VAGGSAGPRGIGAASPFPGGWAPAAGTSARTGRIEPGSPGIGASEPVRTIGRHALGASASFGINTGPCATRSRKWKMGPLKKPEPALAACASFSVTTEPSGMR